MKSAYIGWMLAISGAMFTTMGHYFEYWYLSYVACVFFGLITSLVLSEIR